jgi:UDP-glucose 4-epimerase
MKILITGGAGYIGSHATQALVQAGYETIVLDNLSTGFREAVPAESQFILGDVRDSQHLSYIFNKEQVQAVVHLAAKLNVPESLQFPLEYYDNNTLGTLAVLKACRASHIDKIVFSSTATIYGGSNLETLSESSPALPLHPYASSKAMGEQFLVDYEKAYGIKSVRFRYFNVAGATLDFSNGPRMKDSTHLIKVAAEAATGKRKKMQLFGDNYHTPDGTCLRDYIHILDLAELHVLALRYLEKKPETGITLNCGYGVGVSVKQVIATMKKVSQVDFEVEVSDPRPGDTTSLVANVELLKKTFNWSPRYNDLELICKTSLDWEKPRATT